MFFRRVARRLAGADPATRHTLVLPGNLLMAQERERYLARVIRRRWGPDLGGLRVYEAGCGNGYHLRLMVQWGCRPADLLGVDIDAARIERMQALSPEIPAMAMDAASVPEPDNTYEKVAALQFNCLWPFTC